MLLTTIPAFAGMTSNGMARSLVPNLDIYNHMGYVVWAFPRDRQIGKKVTATGAVASFLRSGRSLSRNQRRGWRGMRDFVSGSSRPGPGPSTPSAEDRMMRPALPPPTCPSAGRLSGKGTGSPLARRHQPRGQRSSRRAGAAVRPVPHQAVPGSKRGRRLPVVTHNIRPCSLRAHHGAAPAARSLRLTYGVIVRARRRIRGRASGRQSLTRSSARSRRESRPAADAPR